MEINVLEEKTCFMCGEAFMAITPVCKQCDALNTQKQAGDLLKIMALIEKQHTDDAVIANESGIPVRSVKWYLHKKKADSNSAKRMGSSKPAGISITDKMYGEYMWVKAEGKVDSPNAFELQDYLNNLIGMGFSDIILDLGGISFFCSNGIRVVLTAYKNLLEKGSFRISNPSKNVVNVLGLVNLDRMLLK